MDVLKKIDSYWFDVRPAEYDGEPALPFCTHCSGKSSMALDDPVTNGLRTMIGSKPVGNFTIVIDGKYG